MGFSTSYNFSANPADKGVGITHTAACKDRFALIVVKDQIETAQAAPGYQTPLLAFSIMMEMEAKVVAGKNNENKKPSAF